MFLSMIKKELLQIFRSKATMLMMFLFPLVLITTLSFGLKSMMEGNSIFKDDDSSKVYYTIEGDSFYKEGFLQFKDAIEDSIDVKFEEVKDLDSVKSDIDEYNAFFHVDISNDGFNIYSPENGERNKGKIMRSIFESTLSQFSSFETIGEYNPQALRNIVKSKYDEYVVKDDSGETLEISSSEYYTFAELALIIFYVSSTVAEAVYNENRLTTINRVIMSKVNETMLIGAKVVTGVIVAIFQTLLVYVYSSLVLNVDWGENTLKFILLFICFGLFAAVVGALVGIVSKKETTASGVLNAITIVICFLGGCYTPISMAISIPILSKLMYLSPIYWINTAISSELCNIQSNAYIIAITIPIVISIVCLGIYAILINRKGGLRNA